MAIEQRKFKLNWMEQYKLGNDLTLFGSWSPIRTGTQGYVSFLGTPAEVLESIKTSKTPTKVSLRMYVYYNGAVNFGVHEQSSRPTGGRPWMGTETGWFVTTPTIGWNQWDLTGLVRDNLLKGDIAGVTLWNWAGEPAFEGYGVTGNEFHAEWIVEGDWNTKPDSPRIDYPTFGISANQELTVKMTPPTNESNPSILKYDIRISDDAGKTWTTYPNATTGGVTQFKINTYNMAQTRKAMVSARCYDGEYYSDWSYSDNFIIFHDVAPKAPTGLTPVVGRSIDRSSITTFGWKADPKAIQSGYQFRWRTVDSAGVRGSWNYYPSSSTFVNTQSQYYNMPANTIPVGNFEWAVKTQDDFNLQSLFTTEQLSISINPSTAPNMVYPTQGVTHPTSNMIVEWSSVDQIQYELFLKNSGGVTVWSTSGLTDRSAKIDYALATNNTYKLQARVNSSGIWSSFTITDFSVNYASPALPIIQRIEEAGSGVTNVVYNQGELGINLPALTTDGVTLSPLWQTKKSAGVTDSKIKPLSANSYEVDLTGITGSQYGGVTGLFDATQIPIVEGATYEVVGFSSNAGLRGVIFFYDATGAQLASLGDPVDYTTATFKNEARAGRVAPAGTAKIRVELNNVYNSPMLGVKTIVSGISLRVTSPVTTSLIDVYRREYTPTGDTPWEYLGGNPVTSNIESGNMLPPFTSQGAGYWTKATAGNVTDLVNSSYSLTRTYTSTASTPVWQYSPDFRAGETYTLQVDDIGAYGQLYVRLTSGGANSYYFVRFNTANKVVTFTVPSNYDAGTGYVAINKNDNDSATTGSYTVLNPMLTKGGARQSFSPKPLEGIRGGFLDYTPASQTLYEYKLVAWNLSNKTKSESVPTQFTHKFNDTIIQEIGHFSDLYFLTMVTNRDSSTEVDSALQRFAGRKDPVREYGENETTEISIEWEVDTWFEAKQVHELLNKREVYLYRDGSGRKMFVSTDKVNMKDKQISGFVMSCDFTKTHYEPSVEE